VVLTHGAQQEAQPAASLGKEEEGGINRSQQETKDCTGRLPARGKVPGNPGRSGC